MTDAELIDWIGEHLVTLRHDANGDYVAEWIDPQGDMSETRGTTFREAVEAAL